MRTLIFLIVGLLPSIAFGGEWFDPAWHFRREMTVTWDSEHQGDDGEMAVADFFTAGHALADGSDIRVVSDDGKLCPCRVLKSGPSDFVEIIFQLAKFQTNYAVYWGNAQPAPLPKTVSADVPIKFGLLMEVRGLGVGNGENAKNVEQAWSHGAPEYGAAMIDRPFIGYNPVTSAGHTVARITGSIFAPVDGEYKFAGACADKGSLFIDGKQLLYIPGSPADIRFNTTINLTRGRHDFMMYQVSYGSTLIVSLGWKRPDSQKIEIINRDFFGICARGQTGPMEELKKNLTADFKSENVAECFEHDPTTHDAERGNYSQLFRFTGLLPKDSAVKVDWDFGDGQTASGPNIDHVFITPGVYPVRLTYKLGQESDSQTNKVEVGRDFSKSYEPMTNDPPVQSKIVATYDVAQMPLNWLPWATVLHHKANNNSAMLETAQRLASEPHHGDSALAYQTLLDITQATTTDPGDAVKIWSHVPRQSDLQPRAIKLLANALLWSTGDFAAAKESLTPFLSGHDAGVARRYAQAVLLLGNLDEAKKIFEQQKTPDDNGRGAAMSGAMARSVEFFITEENVEAGEDAWEKWQSKFPEDFLEGYSALLRVKLINLAGHPQAAAKVAEAFALAVPHSSYSPSLLDKASKLLAKTDPAKSAALRTMLKEKYPEDPLSQ